MASTTPVLSVRSFSVLGRFGVERVGIVWLIGDFFGIINVHKVWILFLLNYWISIHNEIVEVFWI